MNFNDSTITAIPAEQIARILQRTGVDASSTSEAAPPTPPSDSVSTGPIEKNDASGGKPEQRPVSVVAASSNAYMLVYRLRDGTVPRTTTSADSTLVSSLLLPEVCPAALCVFAVVRVLHVVCT